MKKILKILLLLVIAILLVFVGIKLFSKPEYSREDIISLMDKLEYNNLYLKIERNYVEGNNTATMEIYKKDNLEHKIEKTSTLNQESWFDFEKYISKDIDHTHKAFNVYYSSTSEYMSSMQTQIDNIFGLVEDTTMKYKYYGKELLDEKEVIKFSLSNNSNQSEQIYYLDVQTNTIIEIDYYDNNELVLKEKYTYSYNTVTDEDVKEFNNADYPEYEYKEVTE